MEFTNRKFRRAVSGWKNNVLYIIITVKHAKRLHQEGAVDKRPVKYRKWTEDGVYRMLL